MCSWHACVCGVLCVQMHMDACVCGVCTCMRVWCVCVCVCGLCVCVCVNSIKSVMEACTKEFYNKMTMKNINLL